MYDEDFIFTQLTSFEIFLYLYEIFDSDFYYQIERADPEDCNINRSKIGSIFGLKKNNGFKDFEDSEYQNQKYRILSTYIALNFKLIYLKKNEYKIDLIVDGIKQLYMYLNNGYTFKVKDTESDGKFRIVRNCIQCDSKADFIEKNGDKVFCGISCQRKYYE